MGMVYRYCCKQCGYVYDKNEAIETHICPQCGNTDFSLVENYEESLRNTNSALTVECPYCHSTNTKKISGLAKGLKVAFWGNAAAGQIAKQWHCNNCGSDF